MIPEHCGKPMEAVGYDPSRAYEDERNWIRRRVYHTTPKIVYQCSICGAIETRKIGNSQRSRALGNQGSPEPRRRSGITMSGAERNRREAKGALCWVVAFFIVTGSMFNFSVNLGLNLSVSLVFTIYGLWLFLAGPKREFYGITEWAHD